MSDSLNSRYRAAALMFFNIVLFFLVFNLVAGVVYWVKDRSALEESTVYSRKFDLDSYSRIDREVAVATGREFDAMGERESYQYHPWTGFIESEFRGRHVNVLPNGQRWTVHEPPPDPGKEPLHVWIFGGSTVFGWGMPDRETIASHLRAALQARLPDRQVRVTNHGHAYYTSSMELGLFLAELRRPEALVEVAIFLNGLNDAMLPTGGRVVPQFSGVAASGWQARKASAYRARETSLGSRLRWWAMQPAFPMLRLADSLRGARERRLPRIGGPIAGHYKVAERPVEVAADAYALNRRATLATGEASGVRIFSFLQPVPGYGAHRARVPEMPDRAVEFYARVEAPAAPGHDLRNALLDLDTPYVDKHHYSDEGNRRLAERIAETVVASL